MPYLVNWLLDGAELGTILFAMGATIIGLGAVCEWLRCWVKARFGKTSFGWSNRKPSSEFIEPRSVEEAYRDFGNQLHAAETSRFDAYFDELETRESDHSFTVRPIDFDPARSPRPWGVDYNVPDDPARRRPFNAFND